MQRGKDKGKRALRKGRTEQQAVATQQIRANKRKEKQSKQHATTLGSFGGGIAKLFGAFSAVHADDDGEEDGAHDAGEQGQWANGVEESGEDDEWWCHLR